MAKYYFYCLCGKYFMELGFIVNVSVADGLWDYICVCVNAYIRKKGVKKKSWSCKFFPEKVIKTILQRQILKSSPSFLVWQFG